MSPDEAVEHLGTIAKSGTREFVAAPGGRADARTPSSSASSASASTRAFIVADRVTVESRRAGLPAEEGVRWSSAGTGEFEVETITAPERGTDVTLHLREGEDDFLEDLEAEVDRRASTPTTSRCRS